MSNPRASHAADEATGHAIDEALKLRPFSRPAPPNRPRRTHVG